MSGPRLSRSWRLRATWWCLLIPPLIRLTSFDWLARRLAGRRLGHPDPSVGDAALAAWVSALLRRLPRPWSHTCLKRAAVLFYLLRRAGRPVELWIGVTRDAGGNLAAHAWLIRDGVPFLEPDPEQPARYQVIARFPGAPAPVTVPLG